MKEAKGPSPCFQVKELTGGGQKELSPWGIWNDTLLIERMMEGWTPEKWIVTDNA